MGKVVIVGGEIVGIKTPTNFTIEPRFKKYKKFLSKEIDSNLFAMRFFVESKGVEFEIIDTRLIGGSFYGKP